MESASSVVVATVKISSPIKNSKSPFKSPMLNHSVSLPMKDIETSTINSNLPTTKDEYAEKHSIISDTIKSIVHAVTSPKQAIEYAIESIVHHKHIDENKETNGTNGSKVTPQRPKQSPQKFPVKQTPLKSPPALEQNSPPPLKSPKAVSSTHEPYEPTVEKSERSSSESSNEPSQAICSLANETHDSATLSPVEENELEVNGKKFRVMSITQKQEKAGRVWYRIRYESLMTETWEEERFVRKTCQKKIEEFEHAQKQAMAELEKEASRRPSKEKPKPKERVPRRKETKEVRETRDSKKGKETKPSAKDKRETTKSEIIHDESDLEIYENQVDEESEVDIGPSEYIVQAIVGERVKNKKREYRVRWEGFSANDDTWEPASNLKNNEIFLEYTENKKLKEANKKRPRKSSDVKPTKKAKLLETKKPFDDSAEEEIDLANEASPRYTTVTRPVSDKDLLLSDIDDEKEPKTDPTPHQSADEINPASISPNQLSKEKAERERLDLELARSFAMEETLSSQKQSKKKRKDLFSEEEYDQSDHSEAQYEVEKILKVREDPERGLLYLVKWKGFEKSESTWETLEHLQGTADEAIEEFEQNEREEQEKKVKKSSKKKAR